MLERPRYLQAIVDCFKAGGLNPQREGLLETGHTFEPAEGFAPTVIARHPHSSAE
jgi:hypothetical protein